MSLFDFSPEELLSFFAVLVRYSVLIAVLPLVGDRMVPMPVKVLLSLAITFALFPALVRSGEVNPSEALAWGHTAGGIIITIGLEALFGLCLGFTAKIAFDSIQFGSNLVGGFMGFASASQFDPHQESQSQVVAEIQMAIAMLLFLSLDGHHLMLRASLESYKIVGLGKAGFGALFATKWLELTNEVIRFGLQISAPIAVSLFAVNVAFGLMAKTLPQMNLLTMSLGVTAMVGLVVLFLSMPEFTGIVSVIFDRMGDQMLSMMAAMKGT